ncbi:hypothetical protein L917_13635, partial [Phytophthora nicotianae]
MRVDQSLTIPINNVRAQQGQKMKRNTNPEDDCGIRCEKRLNDDGQTQLEESMDKEDDVESEYLACHDDDDAPMIEQGSESPMDLDMIERE